jgi:hypothetical protein
LKERVELFLATRESLVKSLTWIMWNWDFSPSWPFFFLNFCMWVYRRLVESLGI